MAGRRPEVARPRAPAVRGDGGCDASSTVLDGKHEHGVQEREANMMVVLVRSEGADRGDNGRGTGELGARPRRPRCGHGQRVRASGRGRERVREAKRGSSA